MKKLFYCEYSDTIRQSPDNYLIAYRRETGSWICEPDLAADRTIATKLFTLLFEFENKHEKNPLKLISKVN